MDWIKFGTFCLAAGGLLKQFYDSNIKQKQIDKDRLIAVTVDERRKIQIELFKHVTSILSIDKKTEIGYLKREKIREYLSDIQNHKINIWINLNSDNKYQKKFRAECDLLVKLVSAFLEDPQENQHLQYLSEVEVIRKKIWRLIDQYIEDEERLINEMLS